MPAQSCEHLGRCQVQLVQQKCVRVNHADVVRVEQFYWKVCEVERDDRLPAARNGGGKHMSVVGVRQFDLRGYRSSILNKRSVERAVHQHQRAFEC